MVQHWCGPCKLVLPSVEWAEREYEGQLKVVKVEADSNKDLVEKFKVPPPKCSPCHPRCVARPQSTN